jgi:hypothetical protein
MLKKMPKKNLTYPQAVIRFPRMNPFGDADRDGKLNMFDCKPFNKKKHSAIFRDEIANRLYGHQKDPKGAYKKVKETVMASGNRQFNEEQRRKFASERLRKMKYLPDMDYRTTEGKSVIEGVANKSYKIVTPLDIIKHIEKHPQLLKEFEKTRLRFVTPKVMPNAEAITNLKGDEVGFKIIVPRTHNVGEDAEHELGHVAQGAHTKKQQRAQGPNWENRFKLSQKEYDALPVEADAERRRIEKRKEWESWKQEQPGVLQTLPQEHTIIKAKRLPEDWESSAEVIDNKNQQAGMDTGEDRWAVVKGKTIMSAPTKKLAKLSAETWEEEVDDYSEDEDVENILEEAGGKEYKEDSGPSAQELIDEVETGEGHNGKD